MDKIGYFDWMYDLVCGDRFAEDISYRKLLKHLNDTEFIYFLSMDSNRAADGTDLRYRYLYETGNNDGFRKQKDKPCSVLEMMVALAIRCEETIMDNPAIGDRTREWFWGMIRSLGLNAMRDDRYDCDYVEEVLTNFLYRKYSPDGRGGLFVIPNCDRDLRKVEIWVQLLWYLDTIT